MRAERRCSWRHRLALWLATGALLFAALGPAIAQSLADSGNQGHASSEICTASGIITLGATAPQDSGKASPAHKQCLWCKLHACTGLTGIKSARLVGATLAGPAPATPPETPARVHFPHYRPDAPRAPPTDLG